MPLNRVFAQQEAAIIGACEEHERQNRSLSDFRRFVIFEDFFVKFGNYKSLFPQYKTQEYISQLAANDPSAPHIPEVYHFFTDDSWRAYLVMERIELTSTPVSNLPERVAQALQWLHGLKAPAEFTIGPLGGSRPRHALFKDYTAPLSFSSIEALERYMNRALLWIRRDSRPNPIFISNEPLVFTQSDMDVSNFGVDTNGKTCLFDFEDVGLLPQSFVSYTMQERDPFVTKVAACLNLPPSSNISSMGRISAILWIVSDPTLGLNKDGMLKSEH